MTPGHRLAEESVSGSWHPALPFLSWGVRGARISRPLAPATSQGRFQEKMSLWPGEKWSSEKGLLRSNFKSSLSRAEDGIDPWTRAPEVFSPAAGQ